MKLLEQWVWGNGVLEIKGDRAGVDGIGDDGSRRVLNRSQRKGSKRTKILYSYMHNKQPHVVQWQDFSLR